MILLEQLRDIFMRGANSKLGKEIQSQSLDFIQRNQKYLLWGLGLSIGFIALVTSPIWVTLAILSSPLFIGAILLFIFTDLFNPLIKLFYSFSFGTFTSYYQSKDLRFINAGYADLESKDGVFLEEEKDNYDVLNLQLYNYLVMKFGGVDNLNGLNLLETGCGRGGGLNYLAKELNPHSAVGIDICKCQIDFCQKNMMGDNLNINFIVNDAENLDQIISKNTIDYAIDVESSFFYPNKARFYQQVSQALRKDGVFLYASIVPAFLLKSQEKKLLQQFDIVKSEEISKETLRALKLGTKAYDQLFMKNFPRWSHWFLREIFGLEGSFLHKVFENRMFIYKIYALNKKKAHYD